MVVIDNLKALSLSQDLNQAITEKALALFREHAISFEILSVYANAIIVKVIRHDAADNNDLSHKELATITKTLLQEFVPEFLVHVQTG